MTDRHAGYVVTLANDTRDDDAEAVVTALRMIKGVIAVDPVPADSALHIAQMRADTEWRQRIQRMVSDRTRESR